MAENGLSDRELFDLFKTKVAGLTMGHIREFRRACERAGVSPESELIHPTIRKGRFVPLTSIDYLRQRAESSGVYAGADDIKFQERDNGYPESATATVYKIVGGNRVSFTSTVWWDEYYPGDGKPGFFWRKMPHVMLGKCAEAAALRRAFPGLLSGLYISEEFQSDRDREEPSENPRKSGKPTTPVVKPVSPEELKGNGTPKKTYKNSDKKYKRNGKTEKDRLISHFLKTAKEYGVDLTDEETISILRNLASAVTNGRCDSPKEMAESELRRFLNAFEQSFRSEKSQRESVTEENGEEEDELESEVVEYASH